MRFLTELENVTLVGHQGFLMLPNGAYLMDNTRPELIYGNADYFRRCILKPERIDSPCFVAISPYSRFYYEWMHDVLPRFHLVLERLPKDTKFIISDETPVAYVNMLKYFGIDIAKSLVVHDRNRPLVLSRLYYGSMASHHFGENQQALEWCRNLLWQAAGVTPASEKWIYLSRKKAGCRRIVNEEQFESLMSSLGFETVVAEDLSIPEQIRTFSRASRIVSPHGAGLFNALFMPPGGAVLELFPGKISYRTYFYSLSSSLGHRYWYEKCTPEPPNEWNHMLVDLKSIHKTLDRLIKP